MDEKNGIIEAARVLGEEILRLNDELRFAGYQIENLKAEREKLEAENELLTRKLDSVKEYAESYAG
jgi:cell division protein FtsB